MNKIHLTLLASAAAMFFACGSQDGSPAELKNSHLGYISPFDTLTAEFDSKILDISKLSGENIIPSSSLLHVFYENQPPNSKLYFIGAYDTTQSGIPFHKPGSQDSVVFLNLKNEDDYTQKRAVLYYSTNRILDDINEQSNNSEATAADIDSLGNPLETLVFAGILEHKISGNNYNMDDYYTLKLRANDGLAITAGNFRDSIKIQITEPIGKVDTTFYATKKSPLNVFTYSVGTGHLGADDVLGKLVPFYIRVYDNDANSPPNPYTISVLVSRKQ